MLKRNKLTYNGNVAAHCNMTLVKGTLKSAGPAGSGQIFQPGDVEAGLTIKEGNYTVICDNGRYEQDYHQKLLQCGTDGKFKNVSKGEVTKVKCKREFQIETLGIRERNSL
jgi:hypothetical protein